MTRAEHRDAAATMFSVLNGTVCSIARVDGAQAMFGASSFLAERFITCELIWPIVMAGSDVRRLFDEQFREIGPTDRIIMDGPGERIVVAFGARGADRLALGLGEAGG